LEGHVLLGKGRTADVYSWTDNKVIKIFKEWCLPDWIQYEADIGTRVFNSGVKAPEVFEICKIDDKWGIVFQRIKGGSLLNEFEKTPWKVAEIAREMAALHASIHSCCSEQLPMQNVHLRSAIENSRQWLSADTDKVLEYFDSLPFESAVCHGDFHPGNILRSESGPVAIDWRNAYAGHRASDVARTILMLSSPFLMPEMTPFIKFLLTLVKNYSLKIYLKEYMKLTGICYKDINSWLLPIAASRLREQIPGESGWLVGQIRKELKKITRKCKFS
jgi:aminoglycoside phosphotransferase (APT) family kinase protein